MKIKTKELIDQNNFISHLVLGCFNDAAIKMIKSNPDKNENT